MRIETQKQTLQARDESIKKLLEMLQSKGEGKKYRQSMQAENLYELRRKSFAFEEEDEQVKNSNWKYFILSLIYLWRYLPSYNPLYDDVFLTDYKKNE